MSSPVSARHLIERIESLREFVRGRIPARFQHLLSADDVLQQVWISAHPSFDDFIGRESAELDRWLRTIAKHKLIDALRLARAAKRSVDRRLVADSQRRSASFAQIYANLMAPGKSPSVEARESEIAHTVGISLAALSEDRRRAIELRFVEGLTHREIAERLQKSEAAVNSLLFNALRELRRLLGKADRFLST